MDRMISAQDDPFLSFVDPKLRDETKSKVHFGFLNRKERRALIIGVIASVIGSAIWFAVAPDRSEGAVPSTTNSCILGELPNAEEFALPPLHRNSNHATRSPPVI